MSLLIIVQRTASTAKNKDKKKRKIHNMITKKCYQIITWV